MFLWKKREETLLKFLLQGLLWRHSTSARGELQSLVNTNTPEWLVLADYPSSHCQLAHVTNISFCTHCNDIVQQQFPLLITTLQQRKLRPGYILYLIYPLLPLAPKSFLNQPESGQMEKKKKDIYIYIFFSQKTEAMERDSMKKIPTEKKAPIKTLCFPLYLLKESCKCQCKWWGVWCFDRSKSIIKVRAVSRYFIFSLKNKATL